VGSQPPTGTATSLLSDRRAGFWPKPDVSPEEATPAQIEFAWLLARKPWIVPIPGTTKLEHLGENLGALAVELTPDDLRRIDNASSKITVQGPGTPEALEKRTGL
jgi:diketogulonate reductase-like aldo/keto reductase